MINFERHHRLDQGWSWVIACACATINGLTFGLMRSFGVFFFHIRNDLAVSRQMASWPFALCTSCTYFSGSITGFLISYFDLRQIVFVGILFCSAGFALSFFMGNIVHLIVLIGFLNGFGVGLSFMQTPVILAQYFNRFLATATAISYAGGTVGSFVFPPLIEHFIYAYGLRGSFLIIGAILLNGLPCAMLLRPPRPAAAPKGTGEAGGPLAAILVPGRSLRLVQNRLRRSHRRSDRWLSLRKSSLDLYAERKGNEDEISGLDYRRHMTNSVSYSLDNYRSNYRQTKRMADGFLEAEMMLMEACHFLDNEPTTEHDVEADGNAKDDDEEIFVEVPARGNSMSKFGRGSSSPRRERLAAVTEEPEMDTLSPTAPTAVVATPTSEEAFFARRAARRNKYVQTTPASKGNQFMSSIVVTLTNPMYLILLITHVSFQWAWMTYQMVIYDFGIDNELSGFQSMFILISFAFCDLLGRFTSGWIADRQLVKMNHVVSMCILVIGFLILIISMVNTYSMHVILNILLGYTCGAIIVLFNLLTMEYVGLDHLPIALGVSSFFVGTTSLLRPFIIGFFRDTIGSYNELFQFVGILSLVAALLWLMEPFAILSVKRRGNRKRSRPDSDRA